MNFPSVIWVVFGQKRFIIRNVICLVAVVTVRKFDIYIKSSHVLHIANRITEKNPKILVPDQFSVTFMYKKADEMRKTFILHP